MIARLRQVALAANDLEAAARALEAAFALRIAYRDPHIIHYGLKNAVMPAGAAFIEIVEPVRADASARRFLDRMGGDCGYMIILQTDDCARETARVEAMGVRVVDRIAHRDYEASHFHPADFGGILVSFDQQKNTPDPLADFGDWMPAGPDWRAAQSPRVRDIVEVTIETPDPAALAKRWAALLGAPIAGDDPTRLPLTRGAIRFAQAAPGARTAIRALTLSMDAATPRTEIAGVRFDSVAG